MKCFKGIAFAICFMLAGTSFAQGQMAKRTPEERTQRQVQWMQQNLQLTNDQNKKVYDVILYYARSADSMSNMPRGREKRKERQDMMAGRDAELQKILTTDQYKRYQAHVEEMKQRMRERRAGMQDGGY